MPIYNFNNDFSVKAKQPPNSVPLELKEHPGLRQLSHVEGGRKNFTGNDYTDYSYHLEEFLTPAFRSLDDHMKQYWSGIRVPTKDSFRFMRVKIAGGDKSILIWADDLKEGRVRMPVASLSRESHEFNKDRFSPRYHPMSIRFLNRNGTMAAKVFRPIPYIVNYRMNVWAESKRDAEYILYQVLTRFNPLATFKMYDGKLAGEVTLRYGGSNDASDKEVGYDQYAKVRYEISMSAEAWLPLPEHITKTVIGRVTNFKEMDGDILLTSKGFRFNFEPIQEID